MCVCVCVCVCVFVFVAYIKTPESNAHRTGSQQLPAQVHLAKAGDVLFDSSDAGGGVTVSGTNVVAGQINFTVRAGATRFSIATDAVCSAALAAPGIHFYGAVFDGGPRIATVMVDGVLCDGAANEDTGWKWFPALSAALRGASTMKVAPSFQGTLLRASWWTRMLSTSELVGMYRAFTKHS